MCRNIRRLFNVDPAATEDEIRDAALQYVRKVSGTTRPSKVNAAAFEAAVDEVARATATLVGTLETHAPAQDREAAAARARARAEARYGRAAG